MGVSLVCEAEVVSGLDAVALASQNCISIISVFSCGLNHLFAEKLLLDLRWIRLFKRDGHGENMFHKSTHYSFIKLGWFCSYIAFI